MKKPPNWKNFDGWVALCALVGLVIAAGAYLFVRFVIFKGAAITGKVTQGDIISATATVLGGFTIGGVAVMQYRKHKWGEYQADYQARFAEQQAKLDEDTRTGERLSKAIEHLGHKNENIRISAIYELERLAEDSHRDWERIAKILTRFISSIVEGLEDKEKMPRDARTAADVLQALARKMIEEKAEKASEKNVLCPPPCVFEATEILSTFSVQISEVDFDGHGWRPAEYHNEYLDWSMIKANWLDMTGISLKGANLRFANMQGAHLIEAILQGVNLWDAILESALINRACLKDAILHNANLKDANLCWANLSDVDLRMANLQGVDFR